MRIDWTISLGTLIHLGGVIVAGVILYMKLVQRMETTERRVGTLYIWTRELIRKTPGVDPAVIASTNGEEA